MGAFEINHYDEAISSFEKVLQLYNRDPLESGRQYKALLAENEKTSPLKDGQTRVIAWDQTWLQTYYYLGLAYAHKGDKAGALKQVKDLRTIGRDDYADALMEKIKSLFRD